MQKGEEYVVTVSKSEKTNDGEWDISGGHIIGETKGKSIKFVPDADKEVTIKYTNPNGEKKSRSLTVQN